MSKKMIVGWREWACLPNLNIPMIKVKIDTGAKTSTLHAHEMQIFSKDNRDYVKFIVHPLVRNNSVSKKACAEIVDMRIVKSSNGHKENRVVINSPIKIGDLTWNIDITLTDRNIMHHRMLLGRSAMQMLNIDPSKSYCQGTIPKEQLDDIYGDH